MRRLAAVIFLSAGLAGLSACGSGNPSDAFRSVLERLPEPGASKQAEAEAPEVSALQEEPRAADRPAQAGMAARLRLSPVVGAPPEAVDAMSRRILERSGERGIAVLSPDNANATHDIKGYFSAITEGGRTTVIYVWDIFDASGNRLHRIQGQESAPGTSADGWSSVSAATMETIGARTIDEFAQWLAQRG
jgi:hypothetical protein